MKLTILSREDVPFKIWHMSLSLCSQVKKKNTFVVVKIWKEKREARLGWAGLSFLSSNCNKKNTEFAICYLVTVRCNEKKTLRINIPNFKILYTFQGAASCPAPPLFNQKCPVDTIPYPPCCHIFYAWKCIDL